MFFWTRPLHVSYQEQVKYTIGTLALTVLGLSIFRKIITAYFPRPKVEETAYP